IVNTQDVLRAAILPAGLLVLLALPVGWWAANRGRTDGGDTGAHAAAYSGPQAPTWAEGLVTAAAVTVLVVLLGGVAARRFCAVEAAATGAVTLFAAGLLTRRITGRTLSAMLSEVLATTGALFAPLLAATTFTLMLRLLGTDRLIERWVTGLPGGTTAVTL